MRKMLTLAFVLMVTASMSLAQATGGSTGKHVKTATTKTEGKKATKGKKGHKGAKADLNPQPLPPGRSAPEKQKNPQ